VALPASLPSAIKIAPDWQDGPVLDFGSTYYVVGADNIATPYNLLIYKATDPEGTWSLAGTLSQTDRTLRGFHAQAAGTDLLIGLVGRDAAGSAGVLHVAVFSTTNDTFTFSTRVTTANSVNAHCPTCSIGRRTDGDVLAASSRLDAIMGSDYARACYHRREGTTWTSNLDVTGNTGGSVNYGGPAAVMTPGDRFHIFFKRFSDAALLLSTVLANNNFGQSGSTTPSPAVASGVTLHSDAAPIGTPIAFSDGGIVKVRVPVKLSTGRLAILGFNDADNPTVATIASPVGADTAKASAKGRVLASMLADGATPYLAYVRASDDDVATATGEPWGAETVRKALAGTTALSLGLTDR
jgi:hypothetical protein